MELSKMINNVFESCIHTEYHLIDLSKIKEKRIAVIGENKAEYLNMILNLMLQGKVVIPINPIQTNSQIETLLNISDAEAVLSDNNFQCKSEKKVYQFCEFNNIYNNLEIGISDTPLVFFTSGTTGAPKSVMINKISFTELINLMISQLEISSDDILYLPSHIAFIQSLWAAMIVIFTGGRVIFKDRITYKNFFKELQLNDVTITVMVPTMMNKLVNLYTNTLEECEKLRCIIVGGEVINKDSAILLLNKLKNANIANAYGMVETTAVCCLQYGRDLKNINSVGTSLPGVEVEIKNMDDDGKGEIWIKTNRFMNGYYPNKHTDEWIYTGDRGYKNREGLLFVTGRDSMSINKGGIKINPIEIEQIILQLPDIQLCKVEKISDIIYGENYILEVISEVKDSNRIKELILTNLGKYYLPHSIKFVESIETTSSGKLKRK
ncbi:long-chain fatty acid--CoA ligase [Streptococcus constellatus]|uniref:AMP-binding protein n=1 Tax=Streptococcus constellatus TaxID=76860 RepID=UPI000E5ABF24|nr:AMP-binding protein [Streptococcus constellatus]RID95624.1 long-chain fatty acid--CoA ligase [Streptococcus constellatus]